MEKSGFTDQELVILLRKISYRLMNMHKIYVFKIVNPDPLKHHKSDFISGVRKKADCESSKMLFANILLRSESIMFYYRAMIRETTLDKDEPNVLKGTHPFDKSIERKFMIISRHYLFYFDTIINQIVSLYEYLANCSSYLLIGQHANKFKWKKSITEIRTKGFKDLADVLEKINREFINDLFEIRADIFHYSFLGLSSSYSQDSNGNTQMKFPADKKVTRLLEKSGLISEQEKDIEVRLASNLIIEKSLQYVIEILKVLKASIYEFNQKNLSNPKPLDIMFEEAGFKNMLELNKAFVYHWGYYWDDLAQFKNQDYVTRSMNEMMMPFRHYPED